jgi:hypothetical protein
MSQEILNSAIMQLRAKALETYGIIKDIYRRPVQEGDADKVAALSLKLAQLEGGMLTLQQYAPEIISSVAIAEAESAAAAALAGKVSDVEKEDPPAIVNEEAPEEKAPTADPAPEPTITEEDLAKRSPTYRRSRRSTKKDKS